MFSVAIPTLGVVRPARCDYGGNDRQFKDHNDDQEVNGTNTGPVSPSTTGRLEEGMNQR